MAASGRTSLLRRSLSNSSGIPPSKDYISNNSNPRTLSYSQHQPEPSSQRPRLFSAPLEPTTSIVAEITAAFEENRVASPKVPPLTRCWSPRELSTEPEKVKQLIELFSSKSRQDLSRSATDVSIAGSERKLSSRLSVLSGEIGRARSSLGIPASHGDYSPVRSHPEPQRWALKSPIQVRDPSPTPIRDVYSPTLPSSSTLASPRTDIFDRTKFWERASIDIRKGRAGSQSTSTGKPLAAGIGRIIVSVPSRQTSPKQAPRRGTTPNSPRPTEATERETTPTSSRAEIPDALVPQNTAETRNSNPEARSNTAGSDKFENVPKVARKYLERVNSAEDNSPHQRRSHHSPSPFFSTSPHEEFSRPRAWKLKSPKYVVEPALHHHHHDNRRRRQNGSESSARLSPNPEHGKYRTFASPSPKQYASNLPEWIRNVQSPPFRASQTASLPRIKTTDLDGMDKEHLLVQVPPVAYSGPENTTSDTASSIEDRHGISTTDGAVNTGRSSPGANNTATTIMFGTSLTSKPAPPMASFNHVNVHQYGKQGQSKDGRAEESLEKYGGGSTLTLDTPPIRREISSQSRKTDDGADGIYEIDSPGELYLDHGSEATLAEPPSTESEGDTKGSGSPDVPQNSEQGQSRDFHHFVNAPPSGYKPTQLQTHSLFSSQHANTLRDRLNRSSSHRDRSRSSPTVLHMPPFLPPNSSNNGSAFNNHNNYTDIGSGEGSTISSSYIAFAENEFAGFSDHSLLSTDPTAVNMSSHNNDSSTSTTQNSRRSSGSKLLSESYEQEYLLNYPQCSNDGSQGSKSTTTLAQSIRKPLLARFASLRRKAGAKNGLAESNGNDGAWDERDSFWTRMLEGKWVADV